MPTDSNTNGSFYYFDGKEYKKLCELKSVTFGADFTPISDENTAKLWAQVEGLEIVGDNNGGNT